MEGVKCITVGDGAVGKTCMLISYTTGEFPTEYVPTVFDQHEEMVVFDGRPISLGLWDIRGREFDYLFRPLSYPNTDVFLVCYSTISPTSLENVGNYWLPELREHCPNTPFVLVGTKSDLRKDLCALEKLKAKGASLVDFSRAVDKGQELGASRVIECSAKTQDGLKDVFNEAIKVALAARVKPARKKKKGGCMLL